MGRTRRTNKGLPSRVYLKHGAYYFVSTSNQWIRLGKTKSEMYRKLSELSVEHPVENSMNALFKRYRNEVLPEKAPKTQKENCRELKNLSSFFGSMAPLDVRPMHIAQYVDQRKAKVSANREKALLSHVFSYALRWGIVDFNPCRGIHGNKEKARDRYVTDEEYKTAFNLAPLSIKIAMEISRVTGMRQADILKIKKSDLKDDGLHVQQNKTGKKQIFEYSPSLTSAIELAKSTERKVESFYLITTKYGTKYTSSGFQTAWQRLIKKSGVVPFTFHDLRAKAGSEALDASKLLGNSPAIADKHYIRKPSVVKPNE